MNASIVLNMRRRLINVNATRGNVKGCEKINARDKFDPIKCLFLRGFIKISHIFRNSAPQGGNKNDVILTRTRFLVKGVNLTPKVLILKGV